MWLEALERLRGGDSSDQPADLPSARTNGNSCKVAKVNQNGVCNDGPTLESRPTDVPDGEHMTANLARIAAFVAILLGLSVGRASAQTAAEINIEGPDQLVLVGPSNLANTNFNRATIVLRDLDAGRLKQLLAPIITASLEACKATDIRMITLRAGTSPDRIGGTTSRYGGLGIYANLASHDRNSQGNWFIAPFFFFEGSVTTTSGSTEQVELFEVNRIFLQQNDPTTQEDFFKARTQDVEASLAKFATASLPSAVKKALSSHCQVQPK